jgi:hypothetical protein
MRTLPSKGSKISKPFLREGCEERGGRVFEVTAGIAVEKSVVAAERHGRKKTFR